MDIFHRVYLIACNFGISSLPTVVPPNDLLRCHRSLGTQLHDFSGAYSLCIKCLASQPPIEYHIHL